MPDQPLIPLLLPTQTATAMTGRDSSGTQLLPQFPFDQAIPTGNKTFEWLEEGFLSQIDTNTAPATVKITDLYKGHRLEAVHNSPERIQDRSPDWFFVILLIIVGVFTVLRFFYNKYFNQLFQALFNNNLTLQIVRDENMLVQRASIFLSISFYLTAALLLYKISIIWEWEMWNMGSGILRFMFFGILIAAVYSLKFLLLKFTGWLFDQEREMAIYIFNIFLINNVLGFLLLPVIALLAYNPDLEPLLLIKISFFFIVIAFGYRILRGILAGISYPGFSPLYLFLYLCTLEIAPLAVLIRLVIQ